MNPPIPTIGEPNSTEAADIVSALTILRDVINGNLDSANVANGSLALDDLAPAARDGLLRLAVTASRKIAFGQSLLQYPSSGSGSDTATVTHGLGVTPVVVTATNNEGNSFDFSHILAITVGNFTATTFQMRGVTANGGNIGPGSITVNWVAIG